MVLSLTTAEAVSSERGRGMEQASWSVMTLYPLEMQKLHGYILISGLKKSLAWRLETLMKALQTRRFSPGKI